MHPLDANSYDMLPVPEKRSRTESSEKSKLLFKMLKRFSLAKSVVGLALKFLGGFIRLPLYFPLTIRKGVS